MEVRASVPPAQLVATRAEGAGGQPSPALPVFDVVPLEERLERGLANDRMVASLTSAFGGVALLLACLGPLRHDFLRRDSSRHRTGRSHGARSRPQRRSVARDARGVRSGPRWGGDRRTAGLCGRPRSGLNALRCAARRCRSVSRGRRARWCWSEASPPSCPPTAPPESTRWSLSGGSNEQLPTPNF